MYIQIWAIRFAGKLTYGLVRNEGLVREAEDLGDIVEIGMLSNKRPHCVVHFIVEISDGNLHSPIFFVVDLYVPVHSYWAHMMCTL